MAGCGGLEMMLAVDTYSDNSKVNWCLPKPDYLTPYIPYSGKLLWDF